MPRPMSDRELALRRKAQSRVSQTTGALGLTALGAFAAGRAAGPKVGRYGRAVQRVAPRLKNAKPESADKVALGASTAGAGIGGAGSFNFASILGEESRRSPSSAAKKPVKKSDDAPYMGEVGIAKRYEDEISKIGEWKTIDQRQRTQSRDRKVQQAAGGAASLGAGAVAVGANQPGSRDKIKYKNMYGDVRSAKMSNKMFNESKRETAGRLRYMLKTEAKALSKPAKAGLATIGGAAAVGGAAKGQQTYNQHKINDRRRARVKKDWNPLGREYDPEKRRLKRPETYAAGTAGALGGMSALRGFEAVEYKDQAAAARKKHKKSSALSAKAKGRGKASAAYAVGSAAAGATAAGLHHGKIKTPKSWESYSKSSSSSAFGVVH